MTDRGLVGVTLIAEGGPIDAGYQEHETPAIDRIPHPPRLRSLSGSHVCELVRGGQASAVIRDSRSSDWLFGYFFLP